MIWEEEKHIDLESLAEVDSKSVNSSVDLRSSNEPPCFTDPRYNPTKQLIDMGYNKD